MMQAEEPDDYVIATGETHSIREFLDEAFGHLDLGLEEVCRNRPALLPVGCSRLSSWRCEQSASGARMGAQNRIQGSGATNG